MEVYERIKSRREELGLSLREVAKRMGVNASSVLRYETDAVYSMGLGKLEQIAKALVCSPMYLMGWEKQKPLHDRICEKCAELDEEDRAKVDEYIDFLKSNNKYKRQKGAM